MTPRDDSLPADTVALEARHSTARESPDAGDRTTSYGQVIDWLRQHAGLSSAAEASAARAAALSHEALPLALNRLGLVSDIDLQAAFMAVSGMPAGEGPADSAAAAVLSIAFM